MKWTKYLDDNGAIVEVTRGLGVVWIVARGRHRVKTPAMPPRNSAKECQRDLDVYATRKRWMPVPIFSDRHAHDDPSRAQHLVGRIVGLILPPPFPIWVPVKQTADNAGALTFGHGVVLGLGIIATFMLCASAIWFKRWIVQRVHGANQGD